MATYGDPREKRQSLVCARDTLETRRPSVADTLIYDLVSVVVAVASRSSVHVFSVFSRFAVRVGEILNNARTRLTRAFVTRSHLYGEWCFETVPRGREGAIFI